jgi:hypothetical protein
VLIDSQRRQKLRDLLRAHLQRVTLAMEENKLRVFTAGVLA